MNRNALDVARQLDAGVRVPELARHQAAEGHLANAGGHVIAPASTRPAPAGIDVPGMLWTLVRTDFKSRYHGTLGGFVWALLKPALMFVVLMSVFSLIFASTPHYRLNLIVGLFLWDFFAESTKTGLISLHAKGYLLTKARFPSWVLVLSSLSNAMITLAVFVVTFLVYLAAIGRAPGAVDSRCSSSTSSSTLFIVAGISLGSSVLFLRYRDLNQVWEVVTQAGFFIAPIIYPLDILPERYHIYLYLWPPTPVIQFSRAVLVDGTIPTLKAHLLLVAVAAVVFAAGAAIFRAHSPTAAERSVVAAVNVIEARELAKSFWIPSVRRETVREHVLHLFSAPVVRAPGRAARR